METAIKKYKADAVYFHASQNNTYAVPKVYFYDNSDGKYTQKDKNELHKKLWNGSQVTVYIIADKISISIFDTRQKPNINNEKYAKEMMY